VQEPDEGADQNTDASDYMISTAPPLLGIDVGFSKHRRTTGIAWHVDGKVETSKTYSDWERRRQQLPAEESFAVIAIDGPLLPAGVELHQRHCERVFIRGAFVALFRNAVSPALAISALVSTSAERLAKRRSSSDT